MSTELGVVSLHGPETALQPCFTKPLSRAPPGRYVWCISVLYGLLMNLESNALAVAVASDENVYKLNLKKASREE